MPEELVSNGSHYFFSTATGVVPWRRHPPHLEAPGMKQILTSPVASAALKNKVGSGARLQRGPQLAPRRKRMEESPRTFCSHVCFYFSFEASTPTFRLGWWTIITKESDSLIIRCVPLWSRPHCLSAPFLSSTEMIASFFFFFLLFWWFALMHSGEYSNVVASVPYLLEADDNDAWKLVWCSTANIHRCNSFYDAKQYKGHRYYFSAHQIIGATLTAS